MMMRSRINLSPNLSLMGDRANSLTDSLAMEDKASSLMDNLATEAKVNMAVTSRTEAARASTVVVNHMVVARVSTVANPMATLKATMNHKAMATRKARANTDSLIKVTEVNNLTEIKANLREATTDPKAAVARNPATSLSLMETTRMTLLLSTLRDSKLSIAITHLLENPREM